MNNSTEFSILPFPTNCSHCGASLEDGLWAYAKKGALCKKCLKTAIRKTSEVKFAEMVAKWESQGWQAPRSPKPKKRR